MKLIALLWRRSVHLLVLSILAGILAGFAGTAVLAVVNTAMSAMGHIDIVLLSVFLGLAVLSIFTKMGAKLSLVKMSTSLVRDLRVDLCTRVLGAPLRDVEKNGRSTLLATLTTDIHQLADALVTIPEQCSNAAIATAGLGYLIYLNWWLGLIYLGLFMFGIIAYRLIARAAKPSMKRARALSDQLMHHYDDLISGNKELKMHRARRYDYMHEGMIPTANEMMRQSWRWNWILALGSAHTQIIFFALLGFALFVAPSFSLSVPHVLRGFILISLYVGGPIANFVADMPKFSLAEVSLRKIEALGISLLNAQHRDLKESPGTHSDEFTEVELRGLRYTYSGDGDRSFELGPLDLRIESGELILVTGGNGSGKSSFARVVTGLYPHDSGGLWVNGRTIDDESRDEYRQQFSAVFSDYHLFKPFYGIDRAGIDAKSGELLDKLGLQRKVSIQDGELSTLDLSQGQRRRLALLTALLEDRQIYLFDEWAADQDPTFKRTFYHEIIPLLKSVGKTVIVITHDEQYFGIADRILRFEEGKIVRDELVESRRSASALSY